MSPVAEMLQNNEDIKRLEHFGFWFSIDRTYYEFGEDVEPELICENLVIHDRDNRMVGKVPIEEVTPDYVVGLCDGWFHATGFPYDDYIHSTVARWHVL